MRSLIPVLASLTFIVAPVCTYAADSTTTTTGTSVVHLSEDDLEMVNNSSNLIMFSVEAAAAVNDRVSAPELKKCVEMIASDSKEMKDGLASLMKDKSLAKGALDEDYRENLMKISKSKADEAYETYRDHQLDASENLAEILEDAKDDAKDANLRAFAIKWEPVVKRHIQTLEKMKPIN